MSTARLPLFLTAAVLLGGVGVCALQDHNIHLMAREVAGLLSQNQDISLLREQNRRLNAAAQEARSLREDNANLANLEAQVRLLKSRERQAKGAAAAFAASGGGRWDSSLLSDGGKQVSDHLPVPIAQTPPRYPREMLRAGVSGQVVVDFVVGSDGLVYNSHAVTSTQPGFASAAIQAVNQWVFNPGQQAGSPVNTNMEVPILFAAGKGPSAAPAGNSWF